MASISFESRTILLIALGIVVVIAAILAFRRRLNSIPTWILIAGTTLLALAAGSPNWARHATQSVVVRVDLSPSTRIAAYRDRDYLTHRIARLLGDTPYQIEYFANGLIAPPPNGPALADSMCEQTIYPPTDSVTLLFSDCRFDLPISAPPTYIALDSALEDPPDGAVTQIDTTLGHGRIVTHVAGPSRTLIVSVATPTTRSAFPGDISHPIEIPPSSTVITAQLNAADAWPENDSLTTAIETRQPAEKWWIGSAPAPAGWKQFSPADLPLAPENYLAPSLIALANVRADELDATRQQHLTQYVKSLGGSLLILGGDHAFGAGGYYGTPLDALSPLASNPPTPATQWIILVDASGSMSSPAAGSTRWALATSAAVSLLPRIPPTDLVSIGGFSDTISWWAQSQPASAVATMSLPPATASPHGPTNLQPAIQNVIDSLPGKLPARLLIISDFDATISNANQVATALRAKQIHLDLLAIGEGSALPALRQISSQTTGNTLVSSDPTQWAQSARDLLSAALPDRVEAESVSVVFTNSAIAAAPQSVAAWNRVWLKPDATLLAQSTLASAAIPMSAEWNLGDGRVLAVAFTPSRSLIEALSQHLAATPRDPRISVSHQAGRELVVSVHAIEGTKFLNDHRPTLNVQDAKDSVRVRSYVIPQTAPGEYTLHLPAPRSTQFASVIVNNRTVGRFAVAGHYAPEFEAIGNDRLAMETLASRTGGAVMLPTQNTPIDIKWPSQRTPITAPITLLGTVLIAIAVVMMRRSGEL